MSKMTQKRFDSLYSKHQDFLSSGKKEWRLDLKDQDLSEINMPDQAVFRRARLVGCNFSKAKLAGAKFTEAVLTQSEFRDADLTGAQMMHIDAKHAYFDNAKLNGADFNGAELSAALFYDADARKASFIEAVLVSARFKSADIRGANFRSAVIVKASFNKARHNKTTSGLSGRSIIPAEGAFICFKKAVNHPVGVQPLVLKLQVPADAGRVSPWGGGRKCRVETAKVIGIYDTKGKPTEFKRAFPILKAGFGYGDVKYVLGKMVKPDKWDSDITLECTNGIHVFPTFEEAVGYFP